jgi:uncharacterized DUF497 family protein
MRFEFDETKSKSNFDKHGIDFLAAQSLWADPDLLQFALNVEGERRYIVIGRIEEKHWSAIITYREERIRIISVRRSRDKEVGLYES